MLSISALVMTFSPAIGGGGAAGLPAALAGRTALGVGLATAASLGLVCGVRRGMYALFLLRRLRSLEPGRLVSGEELPEGVAVTLEVPAQGGLKRLPGKIKTVARRWVVLSLDEPPATPIRSGAPLRVTVAGSIAAFRFHALVHDGRAVGSVEDVVIDKPRWMERVQRRAHFRIELNLPASLRVLHGDGGEISLRGTLENLSGGGFRMELNEAVPDGSRVRVRLPQEPLCNATYEARVLHCAAKAGMRGKWVAQCAFEFMPEEVRNTLVSYCFDVQRQRIRERCGKR